MKTLVGEEPIVICRCEDVTEEMILDVLNEGFNSPEEIKRILRCGMGHCQGRTCSSLIARIVARHLGVSVEEVARIVGRPPSCPVSLGDLASCLEVDD